VAAPCGVKPNWNAQVFKRIGARKKFSVADSGLFIPIEMVQGQAGRGLGAGDGKAAAPRADHEMKRLSRGVSS
jgi:hypothetical protein